jgi:UDP-GlcNAc:undecaprenyl-phosphate/decaprenyl-phosphate GlcNAc-1-phosphate transferase
MPTVTADRVVWAVLACGAIVLAAEPPTIALLRRRRVLDIPMERSSHAVPTPRGGGAAIALGLLVAAAIAVASGVVVEGLALGLAVGFFGLLGLVDDLRGLSVLSRLVLQASGAAWVATLIALRLPVPPLAMIAAALGVAVWLVGFVNAFNFMDGVNGISGAHTVIGGVAYACLAGWRRDGFGVAAGLALAVAAAAFLPWNAVRARVFLGDVGSYSIGAALAVLAVRLIADGVPAEAVAGPVALYLADTAWTLRAVDRGAPHPRVPALVRCGLDPCRGHAAGVRPDGAAVPARRGRDARRRGRPGDGRPGRARGARVLPRLAGIARAGGSRRRLRSCRCRRSCRCPAPARGGSDI